MSMQKVKKISFGEEIIKEIINDILYSTPGVATDFNAIIEVCKKDPCINVQYAPKPFLTNIYDLTLKIIPIMGDIDSLLDEKSKTYDISDRERLDKEIDRKEAELFDLKNILKKVEL